MQEEIVEGNKENEQIESISSAENLVVDSATDSDNRHETEQPSSNGNLTYTYWCKVCGNEQRMGP